ncbi:antibiotic biosynthesis monooxygenase [Tateyamaria omphalii]|uniref:putative quinol monooxygenase n=1 Tax=Tateyamaria omphalii TaxID=299262 RepID=UPI001C9925B1|nr:putative quinol monooxygenase [Tateyamaria omphalii]MBY5931674.1 antibiotic biosynthesis monooxygenase [Tateyamaria omphalii]
MPELSIFATIRPKPQYRAEALAAIKSVLDVTRSEPGCRRFELNVDAGEDDALYLVEHWADDAALEAHYAQDYIRDVFAAYETWLAEPVQIVRMRRAA